MQLPTSHFFGMMLMILGIVVAGLALNNLFRPPPQYKRRGFTPIRVIQFLALAIGAVMTTSGTMIIVRAYTDISAAGP